MWGGIIPIPYFPPYLYIYIANQGGGGGGVRALALSYASDSGESRICQWGAKAREWSDRVGEGRGHPHGREIF